MISRDLPVYTAALWRFWRESNPSATFQALIVEAQCERPGHYGIVLQIPTGPAGRGYLCKVFARGEISVHDADGLLQFYIISGFTGLQLLAGWIEGSRKMRP